MSECENCHHLAKKFFPHGVVRNHRNYEWICSKRGKKITKSILRQKCPFFSPYLPYALVSVLFDDNADMTELKQKMHEVEPRLKFNINFGCYAVETTLAKAKILQNLWKKKGYDSLGYINVKRVLIDNPEFINWSEYFP